MIDDRYELVETLGTGGMATVWKAKDTVLDRWVAIKRLLPHFTVDPVGSERFRHEAQASARLSHPGIVTVFDTGIDDDGAYIVLEYVEGETLADMIHRQGSLDLATTVGIVDQVAAALDYAHENGVVHRDVKPANLILAQDGTVQLTDFGIARSVNDPATITQPGAVVGTLAYLAPEVLEGGRITGASDIYSLAAVTYEMLAGRPPFEADNVGALVTAIRSGSRPDLQGVPDAVVSNVAAAMSTDPDLRPPTAGAFATSLLASTTLIIPPDLQIEVPPPSSAPHQSENPTLVMSDGVPTRDERRFRKTPVIAGLALAAMLLTGFAIMSDGPGAGADGDPSATAPVLDTTTTAPTTIAPSTTSAPPTTVAVTPEGIADEIRTHLESLQPSTFKPKDVSKVADRLDELMKEWSEGKLDDLEDRFEKLAEATQELPESPERQHLEEHLAELAEAMGLEFEDDD